MPNKLWGAEPQVSEPWLSFLQAIDRQLTITTTMICMGGFVMNQCYGNPRSTVDIDTCGLEPAAQFKYLDSIAGQGSPLHRRYRVYLQRVTVATIPCDHEERVITIPTPTLENLHLFALEAHDLALSKIERGGERDHYDVLHLANAGHINARTLMERYHDCQRPYMIGNLNAYDATLNIWLSLCWPNQFPA